MKKQKILFVDHVGVIGGAELCLFDISRYYSSHSSVLLFEDGPFREKLEKNNIHVIVFPLSKNVLQVRKESHFVFDLLVIPNIIKTTFRIRKIIAKHDIIYANTQKSLILVAFFSVFFRKKLIFHLHDKLNAEHFSFLHRKIVTIIANLTCSDIIVNSKSTANSFSDNGGNDKKTKLIYNGIDPEQFQKIEIADIIKEKQKLGLSNQWIIGCFSRIAPWKGQHLLLEALPSLPNCTAIFVGDALFGEEAEYFNRLKEITREKGLNERVHFLGFKSDIALLMKICNVIVHTSIVAEPFGRVIVEAMMAKVPVIASNEGGVKEIIEHGKSGLLFKPGDSSDMVGMIKKILEDEQRSHEVVNNAYNWAIKKFSVLGMIENLKNHIFHF